MRILRTVEKSVSRRHYSTPAARYAMQGVFWLKRYFVSFQGERRIRVHTLCVPTTASLQEVIQSADQQCIVGLLAKMAVDRTLNTNLADAREAFINVCVDTIERWDIN